MISMEELNQALAWGLIKVVTQEQYEDAGLFHDLMKYYGDEMVPIVEKWQREHGTDTEQ